MGREGELVEVRGNVARGAGIGVVVPNPADPLAALEDRDVVVARLVQHHGRADTAEPPADNGDRARPAAAPVASVRAECRAHGAETNRTCSARAEALVDEPDCHRALADGGGDSLDRAGVDIADGED